MKSAVNASTDSDVVIFTGSGSTGAVHKLLSSLYIESLEVSLNKTLSVILDMK